MSEPVAIQIRINPERGSKYTSYQVYDAIVQAFWPQHQFYVPSGDVGATAFIALEHPRVPAVLNFINMLPSCTAEELVD